MSLIWVVLVVLGAVATSDAQPVGAFADLALRINLGDQVVVTRGARDAVTGRVVALTPDAITVDTPGAPTVVPGVEVRRIDVRGDALANGVRIGALIGAGAGCALWGAFSGEFRAGDCVQGVLFTGAVGAGLGLGIDAVHVGTTTAYVVPDARSARRQRPAGVVLVARVTW